MWQTHIVLILLGLCTVAKGQATLTDTLATELCECITDDRALPTKGRANRCLNRVGGRFEAQTLRAYGLTVRHPEDWRAIVDTVVERLSLVCPQLVNYAYNLREARSWTDAPTQLSFRYVYQPLGKIQDSLARRLERTLRINGDSGPLMTESRLQRGFTGALTELMPDGRLYLNVMGEITELYLPGEIRKSTDWVRRRSYTLICQRAISRDDRLVWQIVAVDPKDP